MQRIGNVGKSIHSNGCHLLRQRKGEEVGARGRKCKVWGEERVDAGVKL